MSSRLNGDDNAISLDPGFPMLRGLMQLKSVPNMLIVLYGRFAAETIKGHAKRGDQLTREIAEPWPPTSLLTTSGLCQYLVPHPSAACRRSRYGVDPATGNLVASHHPVGVIAAQSIGEPGTQLSLDSKHRSGAAVADDTAQGLSRVEELFEVRTPKGQAYLTEIGGVVQVTEEGDHYVIQVVADDKKSVTFELGKRKAQIKSG
jgi:hypothetical protein